VSEPERKTTILVADDAEGQRMVLEMLLSVDGYEVVTVEDGKAALEYLKDHTPDLAILDVMMTTQYEGFELAREFSENPEFANMPVLMMTSIDVLTTTKSAVQEMAREFRQDPSYRELDVLLVRDVITGKAGVDYRTEKGPSVWLPVDGFLRKPVDAKKLVPAVQHLMEIHAKAN